MTADPAPQPATRTATPTIRTRTWYRVVPRSRRSRLYGDPVTAPPPPRAPTRTAPQPGLLPRTALRYALVVTAGLILLLVLVAGCGAAPLPPAAPSTIAPTNLAPAPPPTTTTPPPTTSTTPEGGEGTSRRAAPPTAPAPAPHAAAPRPAGGTGAATPIWPARDAASAASLQRDVDGGRQPWLLDPVEVAVSYAGSELGYGNPGVFPIAPGRVDLQDGRSAAKATVTLAQTVRRGDGGIWLVTGVQRR